MATATKPATAAAELTELETPYTVGFTVKGVKRFFFNRYDVDDFYAKDESPPGSRKRREHNPESLVWRVDTGELAVPALDFHKALLAAGRYMKDPSATGRRSSKPFLAEALVPDEELCSFGVKAWDEVDVRPTRLKNGSVIPKARPTLLPGWVSTVHISVTMPELLAPSTLSQLMTRAGQCRGIGDGSTIGYGRFVVVQVTEPAELAWS
jgi:hypothetical protein